jgi:hypothetical protein
VALCLGGVILWRSIGPKGIKANSENFAKVQEGMTEAQVEEILGPPTKTKEVDFNDPAEVNRVFGGGPAGALPPDFKWPRYVLKSWEGDKLYEVLFGPQGKVFRKTVRQKDFDLSSAESAQLPVGM